MVDLDNVSACFRLIRSGSRWAKLNSRSADRKHAISGRGIWASKLSGAEGPVVWGLFWHRDELFWLGRFER